MSVYLGDKKIIEVCTNFSGTVATETTTITPSKSVQTRTPSDGKYFSRVTVEAIPDSYIQPSGTLEVSANGVYDVAEKSQVNVNVPSDGAALDIEYAQTPPSDTNKFWIKSAEPTKLKSDYSLDGFDVMTFSELMVISGKKFNYTNPCAAVGNFFYVFGDLANPTSGVTKIDVANGTYETLDVALFEGIQYAAVCVMNTTVYLCASNGKLYAFDTLNDTLAFVTTLNVPKMAKCVAYNGYLYFAGGVKSGSSDPVDSFTRYKPSTNEFTSLANLYEPLKRSLFIEHGGYFYLFGGLLKGGYTENIYRYDFITAKWTLLSVKLPNAICGLKCVIQGDTAYFLMGQYSNTEIWKFDFVGQTVVKSVKSTPNNYNPAAVQIGDDYYCVGSYSEESGFSDKVYKMTTETPLEANTIYIAQGCYGKKVRLISGGKELSVLVRNVYKGDDSGKARYCDAFYHNGTRWINVNTGKAYTA